MLSKKNISTVLSALILTITVSFSFWIAIMLTDHFFLTHMNEIIMNVLKGNIVKYGIMLVVEGALVGVSQLLVSRLFYKRLLSIQ
jgi:purine-cytosine permease-like protein